MLTITEAAQKQVLSVMESQGRSGDGLRLSVVGRRGSSFQYSLGLVEPGHEADDDIVVDAGAFKVYLDPNSAPNLDGVTIGPAPGPRIVFEARRADNDFLYNVGETATGIAHTTTLQLRDGAGLYPTFVPGLLVFGVPVPGVANPDVAVAIDY